MKLKQKEQRITRLVRELNAERHTRDELEAEIKELEKKGEFAVIYFSICYKCV